MFRLYTFKIILSLALWGVSPASLLVSAIPTDYREQARYWESLLQSESPAPNSERKRELLFHQGNALLRIDGDETALSPERQEGVEILLSLTHLSPPDHWAAQAAISLLEVPLDTPPKILHPRPVIGAAIYPPPAPAPSIDKPQLFDIAFNYWEKQPRTEASIAKFLKLLHLARAPGFTLNLDGMDTLPAVFDTTHAQDISRAFLSLPYPTTDPNWVRSIIQRFEAGIGLTTNPDERQLLQLQCILWKIAEGIQSKQRYEEIATELQELLAKSRDHQNETQILSTWLCFRLIATPYRTTATPDEILSLCKRLLERNPQGTSPFSDQAARFVERYYSPRLEIESQNLVSPEDSFDVTIRGQNISSYQLKMRRIQLSTLLENPDKLDGLTQTPDESWWNLGTDETYIPTVPKTKSRFCHILPGKKVGAGFYVLQATAPPENNTQQAPVVDYQFILSTNAVADFLSTGDPDQDWAVFFDAKTGEPLTEVRGAWYWLKQYHDLSTKKVSTKMNLIGTLPPAEDLLISLPSLPNTHPRYHSGHILIAETPSGPLLTQVQPNYLRRQSIQEKRAVMQFDRPLYFPGETIHFRLAVRELKKQKWVAAPWRGALTLVLHVDGETYSFPISLDEFGVFTGEWTIPTDIRPGRYYFTLSNPNALPSLSPTGNRINPNDNTQWSLMQNWFQIASPRVENCSFQALPIAQSDPQNQQTVTLSPGEKFTVRFQAAWFSGEPIAHEQVTYRIVQQRRFDPLTSQWTWVENILDSGSLTTDERGIAAIAWTTPFDSPEQSLRVEATLHSPDGALLSDTIELYLSPTPLSIQLDAPTIQWTGRTIPFHVSTSGNVLSKPNGEVSLIIWREETGDLYTWSPVTNNLQAQTRENRKREVFRQQVKLSGAGDISIPFTPVTPGVYYAEVQAIWDYPTPYRSESQSRVLVLESDTTSLPYEFDGLSLLLAPSVYEKDPDIHLVITTNNVDQPIFLVGAGSGYLFHRIIHAKGNVTHVTLEDPGLEQVVFYATQTDTRWMDSTQFEHVHSSQPRLRAKRSTSHISIQRNKTLPSLAIEILPDEQTQKPGESSYVTILVKDEQGNPVRAQIGLSVADQALLSVLPESERLPAFSQAYAPIPSGVPLSFRDASFLRNKLWESLAPYQQEPVRPRTELRFPASNETWVLSPGLNSSQVKDTLFNTYLASLRLNKETPLAEALIALRAALPAPAREIPFILWNGPLGTIPADNYSGTALEILNQWAFLSQSKWEIQHDSVVLCPLHISQIGFQWTGNNQDYLWIELRSLPESDFTSSHNSFIPSPLPVGRVFAMTAAESTPFLSGMDSSPTGPQISPRSNFRYTAYWNGKLETDDQGKVQFQISYPDQLTSWQWTAVGLDQGYRVGESTLTTRTTLPIQVRLSLPRFLYTGDTATLSAIATNQSNKLLQGELSLSVSSEKESASVEPIRTMVTISQGKNQQLEQVLHADQPQTLKIGGSITTSESGDQVQDSIPILPLTIPQYVGIGSRDTVTSGTSGKLTLTFTLPDNTTIEQSSLRLTLAPSLLRSLGQVFQELRDLHFPQTEQAISRILPECLWRKQYGAEQLPSFEQSRYANLDELLRSSFNILEQNYHPQGFWTWAPQPHAVTPNPDIANTAYVLYASGHLPKLRQTFSSNIAQARQWLLNQLVSIQEDRDLLAWTLYALAVNALPNISLDEQIYEHLDLLWEHRETLTSKAAAWLILTHHSLQSKFPVGTERNRFLLQLLENRKRTLENNLVHWGVESQWRSSSVETTAWAIQALLAIHPKNPSIPLAAEWLFRQQGTQGWNHSRETAFVLITLLEYLQSQQETPFSGEVTLRLNGTPILDLAFIDKQSLQAQELPLPPELLQSGENTLDILPKGSGTLYSQLYLRAAIQATEAGPESHGVQIERSYRRERTWLSLIGKPVFEWQDLLPGQQAHAGERVEVALRIYTKDPLKHLVIKDCFPAGMESEVILAGPAPSPVRVDQKNANTPAWIPNYRIVDRERTWFLIDFLPAGEWEIRYRLNARIPGKFSVPPAFIQPTYFPEIWARTGLRVLSVGK